MGSFRVLLIAYWTVPILLMMLQTHLSVRSVEIFRELADFGLQEVAVKKACRQLSQVYCDCVKASWMDATHDLPPPSTVCVLILYPLSFCFFEGFYEHSKTKVKRLIYILQLNPQQSS